MKILKNKVLIVGIGVLLIAGSICGQEEHRKKRDIRPDRMKGIHFSEKMSEELNLSEAQEEEIKEIMKSSRKGRKEQQEVKMTEIETKKMEVLNTEQLTTFNELKGEQEERATKRKEMHGVIKDFKEKNIEPFVLQKRLELESKLTDEEKAILEKIRNSKPDRSINENRDREGKNAKRQRLSKEDRTLLKDIAGKYAEDIDKLQAEIKANQGTWNKEIQSIKDAYRLEEGMKEKGAKRNGKREVKKGKKVRKGHNEGGKDIRFLLMDIEN